MTTRRALWWLLVGVGGVALVVPVAAGAWSGQVGRGLSGVPIVLTYYLTGVLVFGLRPDHRAARRVLLVAVALAVAFALGALASAARLGGWTLGWPVILLLDAANWGTFLAEVAAFAVFPDGRYARPGHRRLVQAGALLGVLVPLARLAGSAEVSTTQFLWGDAVHAVNPYALPALEPLGAVADVAAQAPLLMLVAGAVLLFLRFRRSSGDLHRQTAWPLLALVLTVLGIALLGLLSPAVNRAPMWVGYLLYGPLLMLLPAGFLIGLLRHRLFDIDLVVRRSLVYGVLWLLIGLVYVGVAGVLGVVAGRRLPLEAAIVLTIAATVVAAPVRRWLERMADRVVYGERTSGYALIRGLGTRLEESPAAEDVAGTVAGTLQAGLRLRWVEVVVGDQVVARAGDDESRGPVTTMPLVTGSEEIGELRCGPRREGQLTDADRELADAFARQAALALRNAQLTAELSARLEDLAASRVRLLQAEDAARRRLERDIHDGVQQELVALLTRMARARGQGRREGGVDEETMTELQLDVRHALENLQELARGIHPTVLSDRGLLEAVEERVARLPIAVHVVSDGVAAGDRFESDVEAAAYFFVCEALANVLKHAEARDVQVALERCADRLSVSVCDTGRGFEPRDTERHGLLGLADRIEALGGSMTVLSRPRRGTRLRADTPTRGWVDA